MDLHFKEIALEDGYVRFLDRTTTPPFSEDISKLAVTVRDLSNKKSQRANLSMQALIGGDSALDVRGELSAIGAPTYVDMVADLKKLALPTANPYVEGAIGWVIRRGELTTKLEYRIEEDKLDAKNDILVGNLKVSPAKEADEVKKRIGLPLGLIVALIKDGDGNVHVKVPISGTLSDKKFDFSDAIWTAVRNVLVNVLKAPFRAIGGLFTSGDDKIEEIKVDPLVFAAGSSVLGPELERQAVRVADFMRRSPYVSLTLSSVTSPADVDTLKERAVAARLQKFQQEQGIPDQAIALRRYYQVIVKDAQLPVSIEDQLLLLRRREPEPTGPLAELRQRRLDVARERLTKVEGIPEARVQAEAAGGAAATTATPAPAGAPSAAAAGAASPSAGGRVEFGIGGRATERSAILRAFVAPRRCAVPHYVMLSTLSESGRKVLHARPGWIRKVNRELSRRGARVLAQYAVLGPYDFVTILEAADNETVSSDLDRDGSARLGADDDHARHSARHLHQPSRAQPIRGRAERKASPTVKVLALHPEKCTGLPPVRAGLLLHADRPLPALQVGDPGLALRGLHLLRARTPAPSARRAGA